MNKKNYANIIYPICPTHNYQTSSFIFIPSFILHLLPLYPYNLYSGASKWVEARLAHDQYSMDMLLTFRKALKIFANTSDKIDTNKHLGWY